MSLVLVVDSFRCDSQMWGLRLYSPPLLVCSVLISGVFNLCFPEDSVSCAVRARVFKCMSHDLCATSTVVLKAWQQQHKTLFVYSEWNAIIVSGPDSPYWCSNYGPQYSVTVEKYRRLRILATRGLCFQLYIQTSSFNDHSSICKPDFPTSKHSSKSCSADVSIVTHWPYGCRIDHCDILTLWLSYRSFFARSLRHFPSYLAFDFINLTNTNIKCVYSLLKALRHSAAPQINALFLFIYLTC